MYKRLSAVLFPIFAVLFAGTALWGYQEHQEKNRILVKAENQYQRAFHDLSNHMDKLHEELGNTLAVSSTSNFHRKGLINMWRLTNQAQSEVNQLPLSMMPFHETESLLANIANFSYQTAMRDLKQDPLNDGEMKILKSLYEQSKEIKTDLQKVQEAVINNRLQWMDVETLLASDNEKQDNDIIDGFRLMNKKVAEAGDLDWGPSVMAMNRRWEMKSLQGPQITAEDAKRRAAEFFGVRDASSMKVAENGTNTDFVTYTVTIPRENKAPLQAEYTKKGGKLLYFLTANTASKKTMNVDQAVNAAAGFLDSHGYPGMRAVSYDEYNNVASITFARVFNGVTVYPEKLSVKVALDDGAIAGLSAGEMLRRGTTKKIAEPKLTEADARKLLNPDFKEKDASLAIVLNDMQEPVLCYEFLGNINGGSYRIYFNADTGFEEKIERIRTSDAQASDGKQ